MINVQTKYQKSKHRKTIALQINVRIMVYISASYNLSFPICYFLGPIADVPSSSVQTSTSSKRTRISFTDAWESMNSGKCRHDQI